MAELNGATGTMTYVDPKSVRIDKYQRAVEADRAAKIAETLDPRLFDPIVVSKRTDGRMYVIDGQHRVEAAKLAKMTKIPARVLSGLSREQEANLFVDAQQRRKPIHAIDRFNAKLIAGDAAYLDVARIVKENGFEIVHHAQATHPKKLRCITLLMSIYKSCGEEFFAKLMKALAGFSVNGEAAHTNDMFIRPLSMVLWKFAGKINVDHLIKAFQKVSIEKVLWKAIRSSKARGSRCVDQMIGIICATYNQSAPPRRLRSKNRRKKAEAEVLS